MSILSARECKKFEKAGKGYLFSAEIKHLDLKYGGEFETTFHRSEAMPLEEQAEGVLKAIKNQLEIDGCKYDANTLSCTAENILEELHFFEDFGKNTAISETAVFFNEADGSEGQYYIILEGAERI